MNRLLIVLSLLSAATLACNAGSGGRSDANATVNAILDTPSGPVIATETPGIGDIKDPDNPDTGAAAPTQTATATATPSPSPTPPERRVGNGPHVTVAACDNEIDFIIDAQDNDWQEQEAGSIQIDEITFGANRWGGEEDLSGMMQLCWTDDLLRIYIEVIDDVHVQTQQGTNQWQGDEVELVFDADVRDDYFEDSTDGDDTQLGLSPGDLAGSELSAVRYVPRPFEELDSIDFNVRRIIGPGGNYVMEIDLPWDELQAEPEIGSIFGFCLALSDNDQVGQASQDSLVSHCPDLVTNDPTTWVTMELE